VLISWLHFMALYVLTGLLFRTIEVNFPESGFAKALMYVQ
jgi:hypothetical protein